MIAEVDVVEDEAHQEVVELPEGEEAERKEARKRLLYVPSTHYNRLP